MGLEWADEQTLRWPIQDLQPWANRAASDGPMKGQCIRAIWDRGTQQCCLDFFGLMFGVLLAASAIVYICTH